MIGCVYESEHCERAVLEYRGMNCMFTPAEGSGYAISASEHPRCGCVFTQLARIFIG